jgi:soluble lytic murein transglycosylase-like protein
LRLVAAAWVLLVLVAGCRPEPEGMPGRPLLAIPGREGAQGRERNDDYDEDNPCTAALPYAEDAAGETDLEVALLMGVIKQESNFNPEAESRTGAQGLMQVLPSGGEHFDCGELYDSEENVLCGARILARYIQRMGGDVYYGVAAYHLGPGNIKRYMQKKEPVPNGGYVKRVLNYRDRFRKAGCAGL